jgi:hypothetical protein
VCDGGDDDDGYGDANADDGDRDAAGSDSDGGTLAVRLISCLLL